MSVVTQKLCTRYAVGKSLQQKICDGARMSAVDAKCHARATGKKDGGRGCIYGPDRVETCEAVLEKLVTGKLVRKGSWSFFFFLVLFEVL